jgi:hypothetical protein
MAVVECETSHPCVSSPASWVATSERMSSTGTKPVLGGEDQLAGGLASDSGVA